MNGMKSRSHASLHAFARSTGRYFAARGGVCRGRRRGNSSRRLGNSSAGGGGGAGRAWRWRRQGKGVSDTAGGLRRLLRESSNQNENAGVIACFSLNTEKLQCF